ncbi:MAG: hypothetical protein WBY53_01065 [Acidobacteriaceae bacterium]
MRLFRLVCVLGVLSVGCGFGVAQTSCKPSDPTGYFEGTAVSHLMGKLTISLNLRCDQGQYAGGMAIPLGPSTLTGGRFDDGRLKLMFDSGVVMDVTVDGAQLQGKITRGDDYGPLELRRVGEAKPPPAPERSDLSKAEWHEDLKFFAAQLAERHANAFHYISRERYEAEVAELDRKLDGLNSDEIYVGLDRIANSIGDGHTYVTLPVDQAFLPIEVARFGDDLRVVAVGPGYERALGARVIKIDGTPIARVHELVYSLTPADETATLREGRADQLLTIGIVLHGMGVARDRDSARFTLAGDDGKEFVVEVKAVAPGESSAVQWSYVTKRLPLFRQRPEDSFWCVSLADARTVYCSFRGYKDLDEKSKRLFEMVKQEHPEKVVIDMRLNGGGDFTVGLRDLVHPIEALPAVNRKGHLFVLIGPSTFSAAMSNAAQFRYQTNAMLVGEPIGERPNSYQEGRNMTLPNSHWQVNYSTKFYKFAESGENLIRPDKEIKTSWKDYEDGRDLVMEWVDVVH